MTKVSDFKNLLNPLLATLKIDVNALEDSQSYVCQINPKVTIQIEEKPEKFLTISSVLPIPETRQEDMYTPWFLLQTNLLGMEHPPILTSALFEEKKLVLWARHSFIELDASALNRLFERFIEQVEQIDAWLQTPPKNKKSNVTDREKGPTALSRKNFDI